MLLIHQWVQYVRFMVAFVTSWGVLHGHVATTNGSLTPYDPAYPGELLRSMIDSLQKQSNLLVVVGCHGQCGIYRTSNLVKHLEYASIRRVVISLKHSKILRNELLVVCDNLSVDQVCEMATNLSHHSRTVLLRQPSDDNNQLHDCPLLINSNLLLYHFDNMQRSVGACFWQLEMT